MTTHRVPPDDATPHRDPYHRHPEPSPETTDAQAEAQRARAGPAELRTFLEAYEPLHAAWLRAPTPDTADARAVYNQVLPFPVSPGAILAALTLCELWEPRLGGFPSSPGIGSPLVEAALTYAARHPMELRLVYAAVRGDWTRDWSPLPWSILTPLTDHPWIETALPFWGPLGALVIIKPPEERTLRAAPALRRDLTAMRTALRHAIARLERIEATDERLHGPRSADDGGDAILNGPVLCELREQLERVETLLDRHLRVLAYYRGRATRATTVKRFGPMVVALAEEINRALPPPRGGDRRYLAEGVFRREVYDRVDATLASVYGVAFTLEDFKGLVRRLRKSAPD